MILVYILLAIILIISMIIISHLKHLKQRQITLINFHRKEENIRSSKLNFDIIYYSAITLVLTSFLVIRKFRSNRKLTY